MRKIDSRLNKTSVKRGFSLVELSIVLVILGLLVGGVLSGQSLIRAAELRSVSSEYARYVAATQSFRDKYFALPGDMNNATRFWGRLNSNADCVTNSTAAVATPGSCDGDGDGIIEAGAATANISIERFQFWRQLALAGLIEGNYTGLAGPGATNGEQPVIGTNVPASKLGRAGFSTYYLNIPTDNVVHYAVQGNTLLFGTAIGNSTGGDALKPEEQWNIDTKLDDGRPGYGTIRGFSSSNVNGGTDCTSSDVASTATYLLNLTGATCSMMILLGA